MKLQKKSNFLLFIFITTFIILTYQIICGKKGIIFYLQQEHTLNKNLALIEKTKIEKLKTTKKIKLLCNKCLDKDFVEEKAKNTLDFAEKDEIVIHRKK